MEGNGVCVEVLALANKIKLVEKALRVGVDQSARCVPVANVVAAQIEVVGNFLDREAPAPDIRNLEITFREEVTTEFFFAWDQRASEGGWIGNDATVRVVELAVTIAVELIVIRHGTGQVQRSGIEALAVFGAQRRVHIRM